MAKYHARPSTQYRYEHYDPKSGRYTLSPSAPPGAAPTARSYGKAELPARGSLRRTRVTV